MNPLRRTVVAAFALAPLTARAQRPQRHPDVVELNPPRHVSSEGKIEVLEFFWYGCIHCYNLEPKIETWLKTLPKDVEFVRVPAVLSSGWARDAVIFYTFEAMGLFDKLHRPFFEAIHRHGLRTDRAQALNDWLERQGVDPKKFESVGKSMGVLVATERAMKLTVDYDVRGTPAMAVHGRYMVGGEAMLNTVNQLVAAVRKNK